MKTKNLLTILALIMGINALTQAQITSVADGNWTNPTTWGGVPPTPGSDVIINHQVVLDIDYGYTSGSITINGAGSLTGNSNMRALALIVGGMGTLTVHGSLNVARIALMSGSLTNNGTVLRDSLYNAVILNNNTGATINTGQFMNSTGGNLTNNGTINTTNFLNIETATNNNSLTTNDFMNSKNFTNGATGLINVGHDFLNSDSLASPTTFVNNGTVYVGNDWLNTESVSGSGKFCVLNNTSNTGLMTGTFDFCDQTGGDVDANTGTIQPTITWCQYPCDLNSDELSKTLEINLYPNPNNGIFSISANTPVSDIEVFNIIGKVVHKQKLLNTTTHININTQPSGVYFYKVFMGKEVVFSGKLVVR